MLTNIDLRVYGHSKIHTEDGHGVTGRDVLPFTPLFE